MAEPVICPPFGRVRAFQAMRRFQQKLAKAWPSELDRCGHRRGAVNASDGRDFCDRGPARGRAVKYFGYRRAKRRGTELSAQDVRWAWPGA